jgi:anti-sigma regulatory factor (Ser/Thr protein kinase)
MTTADEPGPGPGPPSGQAVIWSVSGSVAAQPRSVRLVRHAVVDLVRRHGAPPALLGKVALAVSEAASNVVEHAYPGRRIPGRLHYDADIEDGDLEIVIADDGDGVRADHESAGLGLGLQVIAGVSDDFAITQRRAGLEVWMRFILHPCA